MKNLKKGVQIINCTPHPITFRGVQDVTYPVSGIIPRVSTVDTPDGLLPTVDWPLPLVKRTFGGVTGLPRRKAGTYLIVSAMVLSASDRDDLIAPDTGASAIRGDKGHIVAVIKFIAGGDK